MRTVISIWTWFVIACVVLFGFWIQLAVYLVTAPFDRRRYASGRFLRLMAITCIKLCPIWKFSVRGPLPSEKPRRMVVVGNHCSHTDAFLISHLPWEMKWLAKAELFKIPFLGWCMGLAGDVRVVRGTKSSAKSAMETCAEWLEKGMPVFIFPEGTRSETGEMRPFKDGAFRLAIDTQSPLLPIAVAGTHTALKKHDWRISDATASVRVGTPIPVEGLTLDDVETLKDKARQAIQAMRDELEPPSEAHSD